MTSTAQHHANACSHLENATNVLANRGWQKTSQCVSRVSAVVQKNPWLGVVPVALVAVQLTWTAIKSILGWWNGELSGTRCAKNIVDDLAAIAGGAGGSMAG
ncbi:unnamed protein product, partial [Didymodactylos carnosus]